MLISPQQLLGKNPQEHDHQKALFQWIAVSGTKRYPDMLMAHAVPNGAKLMGIGTEQGKHEGAKMKAEGLRPGVPDIFVPVPLAADHGAPVGGVSAPGWYPGLWIEMKRTGREPRKGDPDGGRSDDQVKWQKKLASQGYAVVTAYGWTGGAHAVARYFAGQLVMPEGGDCLFVLAETDAPW